MIKNRDLIVFSDDWGRHPFSCMHIMKRFLPQNRILWVNTVGMRLPRLRLYDLYRSIEKMGSWFGRSTSREELPANLTVISPVTIPFNNLSSVRRFNRMSVVRAVRKEMSRLRIREPLFLTTLPTANDYVGVFDEVVDVYYCVDEYSKWPGALKDLLEKMERELIQKADVIVATSEELQRTKKKDSLPTHLLPHGVDVNHFRKSRTLEPAPLLKDLRKPVIGYFGLFDERTDSDLIGYMATEKSEWTFAFIGPKEVGAENLLKRKNVFFFPPVPYQELPRYLSVIDVFIIPYKLDELSKYINPLKLKECLAAGRPVVSTPLPEVLKLKEAVAVANTKEGFLDQISEALSKPYNQAAADKILEGEDWSIKAEKMSCYIEEAIKRKNTPKDNCH
jgi:glycosyltransferase involved in cell wall biosynthesis